MASGNLVTNNGRIIAMHRTFEVVPTMTAPLFFKVGTGTNTPSLNDTNLQTSITIGGSASKAIDSTYPAFDDAAIMATTRSVVNTTECNANTITEFGLINSDGTPVLFSRAVFTGIVKTASIQIVFIEKDQVTN